MRKLIVCLAADTCGGQNQQEQPGSEAKQAHPHPRSNRGRDCCFTDRDSLHQLGEPKNSRSQRQSHHGKWCCGCPPSFISTFSVQTNCLPSGLRRPSVWLGHFSVCQLPLCALLQVSVPLGKAFSVNMYMIQQATKPAPHPAQGISSRHRDTDNFNACSLVMLLISGEESSCFLVSLGQQSSLLLVSV